MDAVRTYNGMEGTCSLTIIGTLEEKKNPNTLMKNYLKKCGAIKPHAISQNHVGEKYIQQYTLGSSYEKIRTCRSGTTLWYIKKQRKYYTNLLINRRWKIIPQFPKIGSLRKENRKKHMLMIDICSFCLWQTIRVKESSS